MSQSGHFFAFLAKFPGHVHQPN